MDEKHALRESGSISMVCAMVGRVMDTLLRCRAKKLQEAIIRLGDSPATSCSVVSLEDSLWFLNKYLRDAAQREESLDEVLVPLIEHSLKYEDSKTGNRAMILLSWLFHDHVIFEALAKDMVSIITRKDDHYIALGWCSLVRGLLQYGSTTESHLMNGLRQQHQAFLRILCSSVLHLTNIVCTGSVIREGYEFPTRLAVAAADCILVITKALSDKPLSSRISSEEMRKYRSNDLDKKVIIFGGKSADKKSTNCDAPNSAQMGLLLWENLDQLITLLEKINHAEAFFISLCTRINNIAKLMYFIAKTCILEFHWDQKSRPLHAKGSEEVFKWLKEIKNHYDSNQDEAGPSCCSKPLVETGALLLISCWKHYSSLLLLEDREFPQHVNKHLEQYLSGIQFYSEDRDQELSVSKEGSSETRKFFINCMTLLLGRLHCKKLESVMQDYRTQICNVLLDQLHCADEDIIGGATSIFKFAILRSFGSPDGLIDMQPILRQLLPLLCKNDGSSRAAVLILAEYFSICKEIWCLKEVLKCCESGNATERQNAIYFISETIQVLSDSDNASSDAIIKEVASYLVNFLEDEEITIQQEAIKLLPIINPSLVLPAIIRLICSSNGTRSSASRAFVRILEHNSHCFDTISMMLDCLSNISKDTDPCKTSQGNVMGIDRILKLIPEWSETVQHWDLLIGPLLEKIFSEPSNATVVRFMSYVSEHLADAADIVLGRLILNAKKQEDYCSGSSQQMLFDRLCPLLIIKLLPLRTFNDLNSTTMYGQCLQLSSVLGNLNFIGSDYECIAAYLFSRASCQSEFDDVRKLAAELCGRIHPEILFPVALSQLECAAELKDMLKIKTCLFSVCCSLVVRGGEFVSHAAVFEIRRVLYAILLWPPTEGDEASKAQQGCIDCLALMICAELQALKCGPMSTKDVTGSTTSKAPTIVMVIDYLINKRSQTEKEDAIIMLPPSFRLCMANVLISVCQKVPEAQKKKFAKKTIPHLIDSLEVITVGDIRAACIQFLFSAVFHLKLIILPYAADLLKASLESLRKGSEQEKMAGAKLMTSLMASDDAILQLISDRIWEVRSVLSTVIDSDISSGLRQMCEKLLILLTSSV